MFLNKSTNDNPLTDLQDRQRAPLKHLHRCLENHTRFELSLREISDEEVDYGSFESIANPPTDSDHAWSTSENDRVKRLIDKDGTYILIRMDKRSRFIFAVHEEDEF